jgi:hypothetical protein
LSPHILLIAPSSPYFPFFYLGRSPITMRPFSLYFFHLGRSPIAMRLLLKKKKNTEKQKKQKK